MSASTITWLHLSDLHFRDTAQHRWNQDIVLKELLADIAKCIQEFDLSPDFIVVTGDIAFSGRPAEYELAKQFLDRLLDVTRLAKDRLFLVPGNHDVDRNLIELPAQATTDSLINRDVVSQVLGKPKNRQLLFARFRGYAAFVKDYLPHLSFEGKGYFYVHSLDLAGQKIALLGLNSAWVSSSDEDKAKGLLIGERQTRAALEEASREQATIKIALLHHPFDHLREFDKSDSTAMLLNQCAFVLHGHLHETATTQLVSPDGAATVLTGGTCYATRQYPNMYNWVRLDLGAEGGTVYLRKYSDAQGGFWAKDTTSYRNVPDGKYTFHFPVPVSPSPGSERPTSQSSQEPTSWPGRKEPADQSEESASLPGQGSPADRPVSEAPVDQPGKERLGDEARKTAGPGSRLPPEGQPTPPPRNNTRILSLRACGVIAVFAVALVIALVTWVGGPSPTPTLTATFTSAPTMPPKATFTATPTPTPAPTFTATPMPAATSKTAPAAASPLALAVPCPGWHQTGAAQEQVLISVEPGWVFYAIGEGFGNVGGILRTGGFFITIRGDYHDTIVIYNGAYCDPVPADSRQAPEIRKMLVTVCKGQCPNEITLPSPQP